MNEIPRKQLIILGVLMVAVVGVVGYQIMGSGGTATTSGAKGADPKKPAAPVQRFVEVDVDVDQLLDAMKAVNFDYASSRISRNPMAPLVGLLNEQADSDAAAAVRPGQNRMEIFLKKITGIVWDKVDPRAVIDNEVVSIGYTYPSGVQIYNIEEKRITFKDGDSLIHRDLEDSAS